MKYEVRPGIYIKIDKQDLEMVSSFKWQCSNGSGYYVSRAAYNKKTKKQYRIQLHRELLGAKVGEFVDHINLDTRDNRKSNLRKCTKAQNCQNSKGTRYSKSGYKGVFEVKGGKRKWKAFIVENHNRHYLGVFAEKQEAAKAYNEAAKKYHGEFALLNKIQK